jgi:prevent-host-death family protein
MNVRGGEQLTTTVDVNEARQQLSKLLALARAGNDVIISEASIPIARLTAVTPSSSTRKPRVAGLHAGAIWVSEDFDEPLPDSFWTGTS